MAPRDISVRCRTWSQSGHSGHRVSRANEDAPSKVQSAGAALRFVALGLREGDTGHRGTDGDTSYPTINRVNTCIDLSCSDVHRS